MIKIIEQYEILVKNQLDDSGIQYTDEEIRKCAQGLAWGLNENIFIPSWFYDEITDPNNIGGISDDLNEKISMLFHPYSFMCEIGWGYPVVSAVMRFTPETAISHSTSAIFGVVFEASIKFYPCDCEITETAPYIIADILLNADINHHEASIRLNSIQIDGVYGCEYDFESGIMFSQDMGSIFSSVPEGIDLNKMQEFIRYRAYEYIQVNPQSLGFVTAS